jgi:hypothetical protein
MNAFHWQTPREKPKADYPQKAYYHRKKAGLTGTRQNPDRQWRKKTDNAGDKRGA